MTKSRRPPGEKLSAHTRGYRESVRHGLTRSAWKNRYAWKEDLFAIREREAAEARAKSGDNDPPNRC